MKSIKTTLVLVLGFTIFGLAKAQYQSTLPQQLEAMKKLDVMIGEWEGKGWMQQGQTARTSFTVHEKVESKNAGSTLLIQGLGKDAESQKIVHDAMAVMYYDTFTNTYKFDSHLASGQHKLATGSMENNVFIWGFELPNNAKIKYTLSFTESTWDEIGEYSPDGQNWYKFMEMNLTKI